MRVGIGMGRGLGMVPGMTLNDDGTVEVPLSDEQEARIAERIAERKAKNAQRAEPSPEREFVFEENGVTEDMIVSYLSSRKDVLEKARYRIKMQHAQIQSLKNQLELSEKKGEALRTSMARLRDELKDAKAQLAATQE